MCTSYRNWYGSDDLSMSYEKSDPKLKKGLWNVFEDFLKILTTYFNKSP